MELVSFTGGRNTRLVHDCARYRNEIFCEKLGWDLNTKNGLELDQFDRADTVYIYAQDEDNNICGHARLLPTITPYLIGEVFPELLNGVPIPEESDVWELSRFAASPRNNGREMVGSSERCLSHRLLDKAVEYARSYGVTRLITASPLAVERMIRRAGYQVHRAGPPFRIDNQAVIACWIQID